MHWQHGQWFCRQLYDCYAFWRWIPSLDRYNKMVIFVAKPISNVYQMNRSLGRSRFYHERFKIRCVQKKSLLQNRDVHAYTVVYSNKYVYVNEGFIFLPLEQMKSVFFFIEIQPPANKFKQQQQQQPKRNATQSENNNYEKRKSMHETADDKKRETKNHIFLV